MHIEEKALRRFLRRKLADYKVPRRVVFLPALPRNATGTKYSKPACVFGACSGQKHSEACRSAAAIEPHRVDGVPTMIKSLRGIGQVYVAPGRHFRPSLYQLTLGTATPLSYLQ